MTDPGYLCGLADGRELCNECHTDDNYESKLGLMPGNLTYNFQVVSPFKPIK